MDWRLPLPERATVARNFRLAAVLTEPGGTIDGARCIPVDGNWQDRVAGAAELPFVDDASLPLVLNLSSGTTGAPKAAVVSHANYTQRLRNNVAACGPVAGLRYLSVSPLYFSAGGHFCLMTLLQGGTVILYPPMFGAEEYVDAVREHDATMAFLVPTVLRWLLALPIDEPPLLPSLKLLIAAASPLTAEERLQIVQRLTPNLYDMYGSAGGGTITILRPGEIGRPRRYGRPRRWRRTAAGRGRRGRRAAGGDRWPGAPAGCRRVHRLVRHVRSRRHRRQSRVRSA